MIERYLIAKGARLIEKQTCQDCRQAWAESGLVRIFESDEKPNSEICLEKTCITFVRVVDFSRTQ